MNAAHQTGAQQAAIVSIEPPPLAAGFVRVRVAACGICGSNLHGWADPSHAFGRVDGPGMVGHEIAGTVTEVADDVTAPAVGARVCIEPNQARACGACGRCRSGAFWFCTRPAQLPVWGFAEEVVIRADGARPLPDDLDLELGALVEPLACSVHGISHSYAAVSRDGTLKGARVAVIGAGALGLFAVAAAASLGAGDVAVLARHPHQAELATRVGATTIVMSDDARHARILRDLEADLVVEAVGGSAATLDLAATVVGPGGEISVLGLFDATQRLDARRATFRETRLFFPVGYGCVHDRSDYDHAIGILATDPATYRDFITHRFSLGEINDAFATAADKSTRSVKVLVAPDPLTA